MNSKIRNKINETKKKIEVNKAEKENRLINEGFNLFITQGINNTSVQDIVDKANVFSVKAEDMHTKPNRRDFHFLDFNPFDLSFNLLVFICYPLLFVQILKKFNINQTILL